MKRNKWLSRRFIAATWAAFLISWIVFTRQANMLDLAYMLVGIIALWVGGETYLKKALPKE